MAIFPNVEVEPVVQSGDRTRISAAKSFVTADESGISFVEIDPGTGSFVDVTNAEDPNDMSSAYVDYAHIVGSTANKTVRVRITSGLGGNSVASETMQIVTAADDKLFSSDSDLASSEPDILKWVQPGRNTFKNIHRAAQDEIIRYLDEKGYTDAQLNPLTKAAVIDLNEVRLWSKFAALRMIFEGLSNTVDDIFRNKADRYYKNEVAHRDKSLIRLDVDGDGQTFQDEGVYIQSGNLFRR